MSERLELSLVSAATKIQSAKGAGRDGFQFLWGSKESE